MRNILFFGDSLTAGYGMTDVHSQSYPALIQQKINAAGLNYHVINGGLSGDTSSGGLARLDYWTNRSIDVFILELGINDMLRSISPATTAKNLQTIIDKVKAKFPKVKLGLLGVELPAFLRTGVVAAFHAIYPQLAEKNHMAFVPFFLQGVMGKPHLNLPDGLHPTAEGYKIIAENVWPMVKTLIVDEVSG